LRIGVNALYLIPGGVGGTEVYLRSLLPALAQAGPGHEFILFTNRETGTALAPPAPNFRLAPQPVRAGWRPARILWEQAVLPVATLRHRIDVLFNPGFTAPLAAPCPQLTVFHDLQHLRHPEFFRPLDLPFWRVLLYGSARRSRRLIAVSEATRDDLVAFYRLPPAKIDVVPHGVDERMFDLAPRRAPEPFLLCVSTLHPHKNLGRLLDAFAGLRRARPELRLVLAGLKGFATRAVQERVAALGLGEAVRVTGWLPREELYDLFRTAWAFVYPSTFEGFGMPVLEAMAAGVPTACSDIPPLRELAADAVLRFDPLDPAALSESLARLVSDPAERARLSAAGPAQARRFSWRRAAAATLAALESCARSQTVPPGQ
jgi:glycosyltransferase involved in cell wall biosynthesis